jgi:hypothetical protein
MCDVEDEEQAREFLSESRGLAGQANVDVLCVCECASVVRHLQCLHRFCKGLLGMQFQEAFGTR